MAESQKQHERTRDEASEAMTPADASTPNPAEAESDLGAQIDALTEQVRDVREELGGAEDESTAEKNETSDSNESNASVENKAKASPEMRDEAPADLPKNDATSNESPAKDNDGNPEQADAVDEEKSKTTPDAPVERSVEAQAEQQHQADQQEDDTVNATAHASSATVEHKQADPEQESVEQLDTSLADDLDALLEGEFESVDDVLDDVFDSHGQYVSKTEEPAADERARSDDDGLHEAFSDDTPEEVAKSMINDEPAESTAAPEREQINDDGAEPDTTAEPETDAAADGGEDEDGPVNEPVQAASGDESAGSEDDDSSTSANAEPEDVPTGESGGEDGPSSTQPTVEPAEQPKQPARPSSRTGASAARQTAPAGAPDGEAQARAGVKLSDVLEHAVPVVKSALAVVNAPLRLLPTPVRAVVDWIALSLIFWVPIIWAIVLFVV